MAMSTMHPLVADENPSSASCTHAGTQPACTTRSLPRHVVLCTPEIAFGDEMERYMEAQRRAMKKQWIFDIINGSAEKEFCLLETKDYIVLPDTEAPNSATLLNWLVVFKDTSLRTIRDLKAEHVPMLRQCHEDCIRKICNITSFSRNNVVAYFHYLPSVFQLHLHVCAPSGQYTTFDVYKIHPIENVISNLEQYPDYYRKTNIATVIMVKGELQQIFNGTWMQASSSSLSDGSVTSECGELDV